jgi:hypothetical protein
MISRPQQKDLFVKILLVLMSTLLTLVVLELGLRFSLFNSLHTPSKETGLRSPSSTLGWQLKPNRDIVINSVDYSVRLRTNANGFRDRERALAKPDDVFRIVVLGDSFVEAYQVQDDETFTRQLEQQLGNKFEVINLGIGGYGTAQALRMLKEIGLAYSPDLVLLSFLPVNDVRNNSWQLESWLWGSANIKTFGRPFVTVDEDGSLQWQEPDYQRSVAWVEKSRAKADKIPYWQKTVLFSLWQRATESRKKTRMPNYDPNVLMGPILKSFVEQTAKNAPTVADYQQAWRQSWSVTERLLLEMRQISNDAGANFLVMSIPAKSQVEPAYRQKLSEHYQGLEFDPIAPSQWLARVASDNDLNVLDLQPVFSQKHDPEKAPLYHAIRDRHWNAAGHQLVALQLSLFLRQQGFIPAY